MKCKSCGSERWFEAARVVFCPECGSRDIEFQSDPLAESRAVPQVDQGVGVPSFLRTSSQPSSQPPSQRPSKSISDIVSGRSPSKWEMQCTSCEYRLFVRERNFESCPKCSSDAIEYIRLDADGGDGDQGEMVGIWEYEKIEKQIKPVLGVIGLILTLVGVGILVSAQSSGISDFRSLLFLGSGAILLSSGLICVYAGIKYNPGAYTKEEVKVFLEKVAMGLFGLIFALVGLSIISLSLGVGGSNFWSSLILGLILLTSGLICMYVGIKYRPGKYTKEEIETFLGKVVVGIVGLVMCISGAFLAFFGLIGGGGGIVGIGVTLVIIGFIILAVITKGEIFECCAGC